ncbi:hypothetical protein I5U23_01245 [Stenotrophomonas maltophilia]|uniref:Uncharacterized protein n=1 Tax=Stenotrophomonas riyadhensis TaxID=2859893 RepID=A0ABT2XDX8_9GAMM|nr:hypothetical protein [Stenotrophomonas sp. CFS3442]MBH1616555.1 hypothetical protein [Stenotrophomonas maltophilia]MCV0324133.1 hypothetical protein [Stenotrophomonas sp. CFS3442]HEL4245591.1 hypothetical protein [Stenotrophomonas maltophilia]
MTIQDSIIYEYNNYLSFIHRSPQYESVEDCPSENVGLSARMPVRATPDELGAATLEAMRRYGEIRPEFPIWELGKLRRKLCTWTGAKSYADLQKNSRIVIAMTDTSRGTIQLIPFDNSNMNPWESMLVDKIAELPIDIEARALGAHFIKVFGHTTYHPDRKHPHWT